MKTDQRKKMVVDEPLQRGLAKRIIMYWCITWLLVFSLPIVVRTLTADLPFELLAAEIINDFWFPIVVSLFLLPVIVWDSFRFSNRIAGPLRRVDNTLRQAIAEQPVESVEIREDDYCQDLVEGVNQLTELLDAGNGRRNSKAENQLETV